MNAARDAENDPRKAALIMELRRRGISDARVLAAVERTPRERFMPADLSHLAYADQALPIDCGQTISQPFVVALMSEALGVRPTDRVLEIGTGSGYQTAILSKLAAEVFTVERWPSLLEAAKERLAATGANNVRFRLGDGMQGWPEEAPFDRIIVTAAAPSRPDALLAQLAAGGVLVAPVGEDDRQELVRYVRDEDGVRPEPLAAVRFVPLLPGVAGS